MNWPSKVLASSTVLMMGAVVAFKGHPPVKALQDTASQVEQSLASRQIQGEYYFGDGLGVNCVLNLKSDGRFAFTWTGCLGVYDRNEGAYDIQHDKIVLHPERENVREGFAGTPTSFYPILWGDRIFLISEEKMLGFCTSLARGWDGSNVLGMHGDKYVRALGSKTDLTKPATGNPKVPPAFQRWTRTIFEAKVSRVESDQIFLNKGTTDGLAPGTMLVTRGTGFKELLADSLQIVEVDTCQETTAVARCVRRGTRSPKIGSTLVPFDTETF